MFPALLKILILKQISRKEDRCIGYLVSLLCTSLKNVKFILTQEESKNMFQTSNPPFVSVVS